MKKLTLLSLLLATACIDVGGVVPPAEPPPRDPEPLGRLVVEALELQLAQPAPERLEHRVFQLDDTTLEGDVTWESCEGVEVALADVCGRLYSDGEVATCSYQATFFYANATPRCAVRFESRESYDQPMADLFVLDFAGAASVGPPPSCGNGEVDLGEACDDGNLELWDGCDVSCQIEEFNGCESVIQHEFAEAALAFVDKDTWRGPRSHLMVNEGEPLVAVDAESCASARATADHVCERLAFEMPFVSWCWAETELTSSSGAPACAVRLHAAFHEQAPEMGVFTTSLPGVLAFTIR